MKRRVSPDGRESLDELLAGIRTALATRNKEPDTEEVTGLLKHAHFVEAMVERVLSGKRDVLPDEIAWHAFVLGYYVNQFAARAGVPMMEKYLNSKAGIQRTHESRRTGYLKTVKQHKEEIEEFITAFLDQKPERAERDKKSILESLNNAYGYGNDETLTDEEKQEIRENRKREGEARPLSADVLRKHESMAWKRWLKKRAEKIRAAP